MYALRTGTRHVSFIMCDKIFKQLLTTQECSRFGELTKTDHCDKRLSGYVNLLSLVIVLYEYIIRNAVWKFFF